MTPRTARILRNAAIGAGLVGAWEFAWWWRRALKRQSVYNEALAEARRLRVPLLVVGAPDGGTTPGAGCGDVTVDLSSSYCPNHIKADITKPLPLAPRSVVVYVSCTLEYVDDLQAALVELCRVSASPNLYVVRVEPWTLTAYLYPGAKRTLPEHVSC